MLDHKVQLDPLDEDWTDFVLGLPAGHFGKEGSGGGLVFGLPTFLDPVINVTEWPTDCNSVWHKAEFIEPISCIEAEPEAKLFSTSSSEFISSSESENATRVPAELESTRRS